VGIAEVGGGCCWIVVVVLSHLLKSYQVDRGSTSAQEPCNPQREAGSTPFECAGMWLLITSIPAPKPIPMRTIRISMDDRRDMVSGGVTTARAAVLAGCHCIRTRDDLQG
jgi:hypothetical protein